MPTISISLPASMLAEFEAEANLARHRSGSKVTTQDVIRRYIRLGIAYQKVLDAGEENDLQPRDE